MNDLSSEEVADSVTDTENLEENEDDTTGDIDIGCDCTKHGTIAEQLIETLVRKKVSHRNHIPVSQHY